MSEERSPEPAARARPAVDCMACRHFFVTWDAQFPRGCRAFDMRSVELPSVVVKRESGRECELFERRR